MEITIINKDNVQFAEITSDGIVINNVEDALDIMADCAYRGATKIIVSEKNITPDFFDLKTGVAGEILQKFSTYSTQLAIIGDFSRYTSKSLNDFIYESNKAGRIVFASNVELAIALLKP